MPVLQVRALEWRPPLVTQVHPGRNRQEPAALGATMRTAEPQQLQEPGIQVRLRIGGERTWNFFSGNKGQFY